MAPGTTITQCSRDWDLLTRFMDIVYSSDCRVFNKPVGLSIFTLPATAPRRGLLEKRLAIQVRASGCNFESASTVIIISPEAFLTPVFMAPGFPVFFWRMTFTPFSEYFDASLKVLSDDPSSINMTS